MCNHIFIYAEDKRENYNPDAKTLTGVCKYCGAKQKSYGRRWSIPIEENFLNKSLMANHNSIILTKLE